MEKENVFPDRSSLKKFLKKTMQRKHLGHNGLPLGHPVIYYISTLRCTLYSKRLPRTAVYIAIWF